MDERTALSKMIAPGQPRPTKWLNGVIQVIVTRTCDLDCFGCTQGSNLAGKASFMSPEHFEQALESLAGYTGVVGTFGGNPCTSPHFIAYCELLRKYVPFKQRGLWCNDPIRESYGREMRDTFNPQFSNLNCHLDRDAYNRFKQWWPESYPFGLDKDSRHSPPYVAMKDVLKKPCPTCDTWGIDTIHDENSGRTDHVRCPTCNGAGSVYDEEKGWELIFSCDINRFWSAGIGVFRGQLRAWFCEIAAAQSTLHQDDPDYPDTGLDPMREYDHHGTPITNSAGEPLHVHGGLKWWELKMESFAHQVRKHCHSCGVPLRGFGELAQSNDPTAKEQVSATHASVYKPKRSDRRIELVTVPEQLQQGKIQRLTQYLQNGQL